MKKNDCIAFLALMHWLLASYGWAQFPAGNPIDAVISKTSWTVELEDVLTIPNSSGQKPRVEFLTAGGAPGLAYVIDQRGPIYRKARMDHDWYEDFFKDIVVDTWWKAVTPEQTQVEAEFLWRALRLSAGQRVLDVPCGFGRHALALATQGLHVTGVDVSSEMIAAARKQHQLAEAESKEKLPIDWRVAEMRQLTSPSEFDAAFCFGNSFGYLDRDGMQQFLTGVCQALKPHARFAFDYGLSAESILPRFTQREWAPVDELYFLEDNHYNIAHSCIETTYTFIRDGQIETRTGLHFVYTVAEICRMLQHAGFDGISLQAGYGDEPFELGSPILVVVSEKMR